MTYTVTDIDDLYGFGGDDRPSNVDVLGEHLNTMEEQGWSLVAVVPDHSRWDQDGAKVSVAGAMLILHRPTPARSPALDVFG